MIKERIQELVDFAKTESPNRLATKGWINEDIYLKFGSNSDKLKSNQEVAKISLFWDPVTKLISSLFLIFAIASIVVFSIVSLSSSTFNIGTIQSYFGKGMVQTSPLDINDISNNTNQTLKEEVLNDPSNLISNEIVLTDDSLKEKDIEIGKDEELRNSLKETPAFNSSVKEEITNQTTSIKRKSNFF